jgi:hypothetical protein
MRDDFFRCFGICTLHVFALGVYRRLMGTLFVLMPDRVKWAQRAFLFVYSILRRVIVSDAIELAVRSVAGVNEILASLPSYPSLHPLPKGLYRLTSTPVSSVKTVATLVLPYAGGELQSSMQDILLVLFLYVLFLILFSVDRLLSRLSTVRGVRTMSKDDPVQTKRLAAVASFIDQFLFYSRTVTFSDSDDVRRARESMERTINLLAVRSLESLDM